MLAIAQTLMQIAMKCLEKHFHPILLDNYEYLEPTYVSSWPSRLISSITELEDERNLQISVF